MYLTFLNGTGAGVYADHGLLRLHRVAGIVRQTAAETDSFAFEVKLIVPVPFQGEGRQFGSLKPYRLVGEDLPAFLELHSVDA